MVRERKGEAANRTVDCFRDKSPPFEEAGPGGSAREGEIADGVPSMHDARGSDDVDTEMPTRADIKGGSSTS